MCDKSLLAYATSAATATGIAIAFAVLALCVMPGAYVNATDSGVALPPAEGFNVTAEVEQFKTAALTKIDAFLQYALPQQMRAEGDAIRADTVQQFERCAQLATGKEDIWRFKECAGEELAKSMKALALLVEQAYGRRSGAGSVVAHAFWWKWLKLVVGFM